MPNKKRECRSTFPHYSWAGGKAFVPETELKIAPSDRILCIYGALLSDIKKERLINEDYAAYVIPRPQDPQYRPGILALVADGIGGHAAGEVASTLAAREGDPHMLRRRAARRGRPARGLRGGQRRNL